jgi:hypothetical protein
MMRRCAPLAFPRVPIAPHALDLLRAHRERPCTPRRLGYFPVDGLVSGIRSQRIAAPSRPTDAILRNAAVRPKLIAIKPKSAVLSAAPIPDAVPMMPWAKLK